MDKFHLVDDAIALTEGGSYQAAQALLEQWLVEHPDDVRVWSLLAHARLLDGQFVRATAALDAGESIAPDDVALMRNRARLVLRTIGSHDALPLAQRANALAPDELAGWLVLAEVLSANQQDASALEWIERTLLAQPGHADALAVRAFIRLRQGNLYGAQADAESALATKPHLALLWGMRATLLHRRGDLCSAIRSARKGLMHEPANITLMVILAEYLRQDQKESEAVALLSRAGLAAPSDFNVWLSLGMALQQIGDLDQARDAYDKALTIDPKSALTANNLGSLRLAAQDNAGALVWFNKAIALDPDFSTGFANRANALRKLRRFPEAEQACRKAIDLNPRSFEALVILGGVQQEMGLLAEARASWEDALTIRERSPQLLYDLAQNLWYADDVDGAIHLTHKVFEMDRTGVGLRAATDLAIWCFLNGDPDGVSEYLRLSEPILRQEGREYRNSRIYRGYVNMLSALSIADSGEKVPLLQGKRLTVIGESHALAAHGVTAHVRGMAFRCYAEWIPGCKQHHLGMAGLNQFKKKFEAIAARMVDHSLVVLAIGEIDCRHDDGILKFLKSHPNDSLQPTAERTISSYLDYVHKILGSRTCEVVVQGVPCPRPDAPWLTPTELSEWVNLVAIFNSLLRRAVAARQLGFLDAHALTDRGDGRSNLRWHLDSFHLVPSAMQAMFTHHFVPPLASSDG